MIKEILEEMESFLAVMRDRKNVQKIFKYYKNKEYLVLFLKQYAGLIANIKSIALLVENDIIEDALTILRKYMETYFVLMSIYEHPDLVDLYIVHDTFIGKKACNVDLDAVRQFRAGQPEGYFEYGYIDKLVTKNQNFRYSMRRVAEVGKVDKFMYIYSLCNNFVHNNLSSVSLDISNGKEVIIKACNETSNHMIKKFSSIIK